jgi:HK97 gp10 family phage protein
MGYHKDLNAMGGRAPRSSGSASSGKTSVELVGSDILTARLLAIPEKIRRQVETQAIRQGNQLVLTSLRQQVPTETGTLQKSLKHDIRKYKGGNLLVGRVGADYNFVKTYKGKKRRPAKYLHLVDLGFKHWRSGKQIEGKHFREKTMEQLKGQIERLFEFAVAEALK